MWLGRCRLPGCVVVVEGDTPAGAAWRLSLHLTRCGPVCPAVCSHRTNTDGAQRRDKPRTDTVLSAAHVEGGPQ